MKTDIHPKWFSQAKVKCACGNTFTIGSTLPALEIEVCSACHPFYTGQMKFVDTAGRVDAFKTKQAKAKKKVVSKKEKRELKRKRKIEKELKKPDTLEEVRAMSKGKSKDKSPSVSLRVNKGKSKSKTKPSKRRKES